MLAERFPQKVAIAAGILEPLAHRIEAGADMFVMPSRYEPCGLNQLYSLKYGTVPVVRATGGLVDTITDLDDNTLAAGRANGFSFRDYSALALSEALHAPATLTLRATSGSGWCEPACNKTGRGPIARDSTPLHLQHHSRVEASRHDRRKRLIAYTRLACGGRRQPEELPSRGRRAGRDPCSNRHANHA